MTNKFSDGHDNLENEKSDEENRVPSCKKDEPSSMKDNSFESNKSKYTQSYIEKEEIVAENVEGVNNTEGGNGFHVHQKQDENNNSFDIDSESLTSMPLSMMMRMIMAKENTILMNLTIHR
jgi:hypothetical protein